MNAVGRLSAGLIHEINNPLNSAVDGLAIWLCSKNPTNSFAECLGELDTALKRIRTVTTDLRSFAYPNSGTTDETFAISSALSAAEPHVGL